MSTSTPQLPDESDVKPAAKPETPKAETAEGTKLGPDEIDAYARDLSMKALQIGVDAGVPTDSMALTMLFTGFLAISELTSPEAAAAVADMFGESLRNGQLRLPRRPAAAAAKP